MLAPIHIMLMTNHLVQQNQMMMSRHRQQQAHNAAIKSKHDALQPVYDTPCEVRNERGKESADCDECEYNFNCPYA